MLISSFSDYALRILIYLAVSQGKQASVREIAERYSISAHHLAKVSQWLVRQELITASRGKGGGLRLAHLPADINIGTVMRALESKSAPVECLREGGKPCTIQGYCKLSPMLAEAQEAFFAALDRYTLAEASAGDMIAAKLGLENLSAAPQR